MAQSSDRDSHGVGYERASEEFLVDKFVNDPYAKRTNEKVDKDTRAAYAAVEKLQKRIRSLTNLTYVIALAVGMVTILVYPNLYYVKDVLKSTPAEYAQFKSIGSIAWSIKPIIGYLEDQVSPLYYRIKSWLVIGSILSTAMCALVSVSTPGLNAYTVMFAIVNLAAVMHDVIAQGTTVIILNLHKTLAET